MRERWAGRTPCYTQLVAENDSIRPEIKGLLDQAQKGSETIQELAFDCLKQFREDCAAALQWQREDGRQLVLQGEDPHVVRQQTEYKVTEARQHLKERLKNLLRTAAEKVI